MSSADFASKACVAAAIVDTQTPKANNDAAKRIRISRVNLGMSLCFHTASPTYNCGTTAARAVRRPAGRSARSSRFANPVISHLTKVVDGRQYGNVLGKSTAIQSSWSFEAENAVYITYCNGTTIEAVVLSRTEGHIRAVPEGAEDIHEFVSLQGTWVSSHDLEPVRIEFAWERKKQNPVPSEQDCICPRELAGELFLMASVGGL
jgi:hypothetical protein